MNKHQYLTYLNKIIHILSTKLKCLKKSHYDHKNTYYINNNKSRYCLNLC